MKTVILSCILAMLSLASFAQVQQYERTQGVKDLVLNPLYKPFYHGVASGDPLQDAVIIWTRITPDSNEIVKDVDWEVALDLDFNQTVQTGTYTTDITKDYTVKLDVQGLNPGTYYYYRFIFDQDTSIVGRTKTAPVGQTNKMRLGVVSCINFQAGYFNALRRLANRNDLDLIVTLGDYIYEYAEGGYGYDSTLGRGHEPDHEMVSLADYRLRYSFYRLDPDMRRIHQLYPFIAVWDDHESANDSYKDGAENHQPATEGPWAIRKENMSTAYHEWMPIRTPDMMNKEKIYRSFSFGNLFDLIMVDTRIIGRDEQVSSVTDTGYSSPNRSLLGNAQLLWLKNELSNSTATYKLLGNQVMLTQFNSVPGQPFNLDAWDGYPAERESLMNYIDSIQMNNFIVLTGDIHTSWASDLTLNPSNITEYNPATGDGSIGVEFVTPSVTSDNFNEITGQAPGSSEAIEQSVLAGNPQIKFVELDDHGYFILDINQQRAQAEWYVGEILQPDLNETLLAIWKTDSGSNRVSEATQPSLSNQNVAPAPDEAPAQNLSLEDYAPQIIASYPNPFIDFVRVQFGLIQASELVIHLRDLQGRTVKTFPAKKYPAGVFSITLEGNDLEPGTYILNIHSDQGHSSIPLIKMH